ncbi:MAG: hypothetical protein AAF658_05865 [Myxococcota bacterium]
MKEDIKELVNQEKIDGFSYQELKAVERGSVVRGRWRLIAASDRMLARKVEATSTPSKRKASRLFESTEG